MFHRTETGVSVFGPTIFICTLDVSDYTVRGTFQKLRASAIKADGFDIVRLFVFFTNLFCRVGRELDGGATSRRAPGRHGSPEPAKRVQDGAVEVTA